MEFCGFCCITCFPSLSWVLLVDIEQLLVCLGNKIFTFNMLYLTQLIYLQEGQEAVFDEFEAVAIPLIPKYNGELLLRLRPNPADFIEASVETPYEIHLVNFPAESDFTAFMRDEERQQFLHLKEAAIRSSFLVKGEKL